MRRSASLVASEQQDLPEGNLASLGPIDVSAVRLDTALLASILFLQRISLPMFGSSMGLETVVALLILGYQFAAGKIFIQFDRLLWFLVLVLVATSSLLLNATSKRSSYGLFLVGWFLLTLTRPSSLDQYKATLQTFQFLVLILSWLAILQFLAHFIINPSRLVMFFGIVPNLSHPGGSVEIGAKSNGIFLSEASTMSQMAALGIIVEVLEFRRPRHLLVIALAFLLAYGGTGLSILLLGLPLAALVNPKAQLPAIVITLFALGLMAAGFIHLSMFTSRLGEFQDPHASGFMRFTSSFWMAADYFKMASLPELFFGKGPGYGAIGTRFYANTSSAWFKLFLEYGAVGTFVLPCFFVYCLRRSWCPKPLLAALIYYQWLLGNIVGASALVMIAVLCTLNGPERRRRGVRDQYPPVTASSVAG